MIDYVASQGYMRGATRVGRMDGEVGVGYKREEIQERGPKV